MVPAQISIAPPYWALLLVNVDLEIVPVTGALLPTNEELFMDTTKSLTLAWEKSTAPPSAVATLFSNTESVIVTNPLLK